MIPLVVILLASDTGRIHTENVNYLLKRLSDAASR